MASGAGQDDALGNLYWLMQQSLPASLIRPPTPPDDYEPPHLAPLAKDSRVSPIGGIDYRTNPMKPRYSYAQLITMAMEAHGGEKVLLTDIYDWLKDSFAYFRIHDGSWQNSIRHNLSLNKRFRKVARDPNDRGKGAYWTLDANRKDPYCIRQRNFRQEPRIPRQRPTVNHPCVNPAVKKYLNELKTTSPIEEEIVISSHLSATLGASVHRRNTSTTSSGTITITTDSCLSPDAEDFGTAEDSSFSGSSSAGGVDDPDTFFSDDQVVFHTTITADPRDRPRLASLSPGSSGEQDTTGKVAVEYNWYDLDCQPQCPAPPASSLKMPDLDSLLGKQQPTTEFLGPPPDHTYSSSTLKMMTHGEGMGNAPCSVPFSPVAPGLPPSLESLLGSVGLSPPTSEKDDCICPPWDELTASLTDGDEIRGDPSWILNELSAVMNA